MNNPREEAERIFNEIKQHIDSIDYYDKTKK